MISSRIEELHQVLAETPPARKSFKQVNPAEKNLATSRREEISYVFDERDIAGWRDTARKNKNSCILAEVATKYQRNQTRVAIMIRENLPHKLFAKNKEIFL